MPQRTNGRYHFRSSILKILKNNYSHGECEVFFAVHYGKAGAMLRDGVSFTFFPWGQKYLLCRILQRAGTLRFCGVCRPAHFKDSKLTNEILLEWNGCRYLHVVPRRTTSQQKQKYQSQILVFICLFYIVEFSWPGRRWLSWSNVI